eukprot:15114651-Ditylum_brightwellii.AAC.1
MQCPIPCLIRHGQHPQRHSSQHASLMTGIPSCSPCPSYTSIFPSSQRNKHRKISMHSSASQRYMLLHQQQALNFYRPAA